MDISKDVTPGIVEEKILQRAPMRTIEHTMQLVTNQTALEKAISDNIMAGDETPIDEDALPKDEVVVHPVLNQEIICDVPAGKVLYIQAGWLDTDTNEKTETYSIQYPADLTPEDMVMRANVQLTFSNQPVPRE
jgi:hypothetical protein